jgi:hypothetical protein
MAYFDIDGAQHSVFLSVRDDDSVTMTILQLCMSTLSKLQQKFIQSAEFAERLVSTLKFRLSNKIKKPEIVGKFMNYSYFLILSPNFYLKFINITKISTSDSASCVSRT